MKPLEPQNTQGAGSGPSLADLDATIIPLAQQLAAELEKAHKQLEKRK